MQAGKHMMKATRTHRVLDRMILGKVADSETNWDSESSSEDEFDTDGDGSSPCSKHRINKQPKTKAKDSKPRSKSSRSCQKSFGPWDKYRLADTRIEESDAPLPSSQGNNIIGNMNKQHEIPSDSRKKKAEQELYLCAYEWKHLCSLCNSAEFDVLSVRVERNDGRVVCAVTGRSPMKDLIKRKGIVMAEVCLDPTADAKYCYPGRACPHCCCAQGDFELARFVREQPQEWRDSKIVVNMSLPRKFASRVAERPQRNEKVFTPRSSD